MSYESTYSNWGLAFIFIILLGIFIIFVIIVATGNDYYKDARKESCRNNLSELSGQLMRAYSADNGNKDYLESIYNTYVSAGGCNSTYNL